MSLGREHGRDRQVDKHAVGHLQNLVHAVSVGLHTRCYARLIELVSLEGSVVDEVELDILEAKVLELLESLSVILDCTGVSRVESY